MDTATLIKENIYLALAYSFRSSVHFCHGGKHEDMLADKMLGRSSEFFIWIPRQQAES